MGENTRAWKKDNNTIYMVTNETGVLVTLKSIDRGITWGQIYQNRNFYTYQVRALGGIPNTDTLVLMGYKEGEEVAIFTSENGGANWTKIWSINSSFCGFMPFLYMSTGRIVMMAQSGNTIYIITSDNLQEFTIRMINGFYGSNLGIFSFVEGDNGKIFGISMSPSGWKNILIYSNNGGNTWGIYEPPAVSFSYTGSFLGNILRLANGTIVALGANTASNPSTLVNYTTNNGASWSGRVLSNFSIYRAIAVQNSIIFQNYTDKKIYRLDNIVNGTPVQVGTATFEINDFLGFE